MRMTELGNLFSFINRGKAPSYVDASNVCVINQACIRWDKIDFSKAKYQDEDCINDAAILMDGDLLVASTGTGTLGRCNVFYAPDDRIYMADTHVTIVRGTKSYSPYVIMCYMMMDATQQQLYAQCVNGSTNQIELSRDKLRRFLVPELDAVEQEIFVQLASCLKRSIELRQRQLRTLDTLIKARFVEMFGDCDYPHTELIELIMEGAGLSYGIVQPGDDGTGDMGVLRPVDLSDGRITTSSIKYIDRSIGDGFKKTELTGEELLITVRGTTGITALTDARVAGMNVTRGIAVIRYDREKINPVYLNAYLNTEESQRYIQEHTRGATLQQINLSDLRVQQILVPPRTLQDEYSAFAQQIDKSKAVVQAALEKARMLFEGLMQEYFRMR